MEEPFDFARYFAKVQMQPFWHAMQVGMAEYGFARPGLHVLDVGCGPGRLIEHLHATGVYAVGLDADRDVAAKFRSLYPTLPLVRALGARLPHADHVFDVTLAGNILFFLDDPLATLREMVRVTKPGGWVSTWQVTERMNQKTAAAYAAAHPELNEFERTHIVNWAAVGENNRRWTRSELSAMFEAAGLKNFETQDVLDGLARYARGAVGRRPGEGSNPL